MFNFANMEFRYEPFPIGIAKPVIDEAMYSEMIRSFPPIELFEYFPKVGKKYSLSEKCNPREYRNIIRTTPVWRRLHSWIKSSEFIDSVERMLRAHHIDLGLDKKRPAGAKLWGQVLTDLGRGRLPRRPLRLRARFEFSNLPADGGCVIPHTDAQKKLITLIVSIVKEGEWTDAWGGGTDINRPKDVRYAFNWVNRNVPFEEVEVCDTFPFAPNQCIVFVKTFNSLHSVRPMTGAGTDALRRTLTINIEEDS
jgi:hypothetical protein